MLRGRMSKRLRTIQQPSPMEDGQGEPKYALEVLLSVIKRRALFVGKLLINLSGQFTSVERTMGK